MRKAIGNCINSFIFETVAFSFAEQLPEAEKVERTVAEGRHNDAQRTTACYIIQNHKSKI